MLKSSKLSLSISLSSGLFLCRIRSLWPANVAQPKTKTIGICINQGKTIMYLISECGLK